MAKYKVGSLVKVSPHNDNENYDSFKNEVLRVTYVSTSIKEHPGYDSSMSGEGLYDLKTESGEDVPFSLYDYELIRA